MKVTKAIVIDQPWIDMILRGEKDWEMRSTSVKFRGFVGLIQKGSGRVVGVANLVDTSGPYDSAALGASIAHHCVGPHIYTAKEYKWRYAWHLTSVQKFAIPVPYKHKNGAVIWVDLDPAAVDAIGRATNNMKVVRDAGSNIGSGRIEALTGHKNASLNFSIEISGGDGNAGKQLQEFLAKQRDKQLTQLDSTLSASPARVNERRTEFDMLFVPRAKDGTCFTQASSNNRGTYTVGEKGDENKFSDYRQALEHLRKMPVAKWRRPNLAGNWGIVSAVDWVQNTN